MLIRGSFRCWSRLGVALCVLLAAPVGAKDQGSPDIQSLATVYEHAVRDTNDDGLADDIAARVILPAQPSTEDVQAAANIAARIGYETTAASLPITIADDQISSMPSGAMSILVGRKNRFVMELVSQSRLRLDSLAPGQGLVAVVPGVAGERASLVVAGVDDAGTLTASLQLAARMPYLWNTAGVSFGAIETQTLEHLRKQGVPATGASVTSIVVDAARRGLFNLRIRVAVPGDKGVAALDVFNALDKAHRFGREGGILDFAAVKSTTIEVVAGKSIVGEAVVQRIGANWRSLVSLAPDPPALTEDELLAFAKADQAPVASPRQPACVGCPAFMVDGMILGGGGGFYSPVVPGTPAEGRTFDLTEVYTINGWFGDRYRDLIPDSLETRLIVGGPAREAFGAAHIAARLGLESTGITLPLARGDATVRDPRNEPSPILMGRGNTLVRALSRAGKIQIDGLKKGEGVVELVPRAFGSATATVVAGADLKGADAASLYLASRLPYVWETRPGDITLDDVKTEVSDFIGGRSSAGQAARAVGALGDILDEVGSAALDSIEVKLFLDEASPRIEKYLERQLGRKVRSQAVSVKTEAIRSKAEVFSQKIATAWEGDEFWSRFRSDVLPRVQAGDSVQIEVWLSEAPSVRSRIAKEAGAELRNKGVVDAKVQVHSAYKQGLFWVTEQVLPELKSRSVTSLHINVRAARSDKDAGARVQQYPARWLKALYPADEILADAIGLPVESFVVEQVEDQANVYSLQAFGPGGEVVYAANFDPHTVEHEYLAGVPGTSWVQVETGHLSARINGAPVLETRITTDLERVRDAYLAEIMPRIREYVLEASDGRPSMEQAPYFRDLVIDAYVSEPDYALAAGVEHVSSAEALQTELSNLTNVALGAAGIRGAGRIVPIVHARDGQESSANITLTLNAAAHGRLDVSYKKAGAATPVSVSRDLRLSGMDAPKVMRIVARADGLAQIGLEVAVADPSVVAGASRAFETLAQLQGEGMFRTDLSYAQVDSLAITLDGAGSRNVLSVKRADANRSSKAHGHDRRPEGPLVTWDHVIDPVESEEIIRKLSYYPSVSAYRKARSYEGRDISVLEITAPSAGRLVSMAKLSAYKPTAMIVGRQHGNEPSSTSFILGLAERLASDPDYRDIVKRVNVALLPIMNPDGATLAGEIRKKRPTDIASPGYLSALAQDVTVSTKLPESGVDPYLWRRWLPDVYLNAHGATSHELVQPLNNYVTAQAPTYAFRRGWYSLAFRVPLDPRHREWEQTALALRDAVAREINADERNRLGNLEDYSRFVRWGHRFMPHLEPLEIHDDVMLFYSDQSSGETLGLRHLASPPPNTPEENREARIGDWPTVTLDGGTIEAADEGATGELLELAIRNGFSAALAHLKYLRDGRYQLERIEEDAPGDGASITTVRVRPVLPPTSSLAE